RWHEIEIVACPLLGHRRSKRTEPFSQLDDAVQLLLDVWQSRIGQNGSMTQRPRPEFRSTLKPGDDFAVGQRLSGIQSRLILALQIFDGQSSALAEIVRQPGDFPMG